jgi:hypothetical protein
MEIETLLLVAIVLILFEYALHLRSKINKTAQEKFDEWKNSYLSDGEEKKLEEK